MASGILAERTLEEVRALAPEVVVLGVASTEPHGPILPYGTDFFYCDDLCRRAVRTLMLTLPDIIAALRGGRHAQDRACQRPRGQHRHDARHAARALRHAGPAD